MLRDRSDEGLGGAGMLRSTSMPNAKSVAERFHRLLKKS